MSPTSGLSILLLAALVVLTAPPARAQFITKEYVQASSATITSKLGVGTGVVSTGIDVRGGSITMERYLVEVYLASATQTGNGTTVSASTWYDVPGAIAGFNLPRTMVVHMRAYGTANSTGGTHCGMRFNVDGTPYGDASWGDVIYFPNGGWMAWTMEREVSLAAGSHQVRVQMIANFANGCLTYPDSYSAARLRISGR